MPEKCCRRIASAAVRDRLDRLPADQHETTTASEFLRQCEELGLEIGDATRAMMERILDRNGDALDYDAVLAATDDLVACCDGRVEIAMDALTVYKAVSGKQMSVEGPFAPS